MSSAVERKRLRDLLSFVVDNRGRTCPTADHGLPLIATNCIKNSTLYPVFEKVRYVDHQTYENWFRAHPKPRDLIFVLKGSPGQVCLAPDPVNFCIAQDMVALRADPSKIDDSYLFAALRSPQIQEEIGKLHVGSLIAHFKKGDFDRLEIPVPDRATQEAIGRIYLVLSQKIELNREMAATLEAMARALYQSWFVDFDPVWAKLEGRAPAHMDPARAALFPDNFGDDGLPQGWENLGLDEIADFLNGAALQKYPAAVGEDFLPVIKISELRNGVSAGTGRASVDVPEKYKVRDGDILFSWSGSLLQKVWTGGNGALNQHLFKVTSKSVPRWFHFFAVDAHLPEFQAIAASKATTMGHIQRHHLTEAMVTMPSSAVMGAADRVIRPMFDAFVQRELESQTLAALRDSLLPRLMSGELRVGEAREQIEEVA